MNMHPTNTTQIDKTLFQDWEKLWQLSSIANYTNNPRWFRAVLASFGYKKYFVSTIYNKKTLLSVMGFVRKKQYGLIVYTLPPEDYVCGNPFVAKSFTKNYFHQILSSVSRRGSIYLTNIPSKTVVQLKASKLPMRAYISSKNYFLLLQKGADGNAQIENRKELLRRVKGVNNINLKAFSGKSKEGLQAVYAIDANSRKQKRGYNIFSMENTKQFYNNLQKEFREKMRIHILYYEDTPIAYEIGFLIKKTYFGTQVGFMETYKHFSPGKVIAVKIADELVQKKVKMIDLGSGDSHIKRLLTRDRTSLYTIIISRNMFALTYLYAIERMRVWTYEKIQRNKSMYTWYRKMKKVIHK